MLGDLVTVARNRRSDVRGAGESAYADRARCCRWGRRCTRYHVAIDVDDRAGVLAAVAHAFAEHDVSIQTVRQEGRGDDAQLVVVSHRATDAALSATVADLRAMDFVRDVSSVMRVEGDGRVSAEPPARTSGAASSRSTATWLDLPADTPTITLREGGTPLVQLRLALRADRRARSGSRSRATTRPARSRTAA